VLLVIVAPEFALADYIINVMLHQKRCQHIKCKVTLKMSISPAQCRGARGLLGWSQSDLSAASKTATKTIADFERGAREPYPRTLEDVRGALEKAGIEFIAKNGGGPGVRLRD
jgi:DNA-binding transcriptional regulator YiaG